MRQTPLPVARQRAGAGYSKYELIAAIFLVFILLLGILIMLAPSGYDPDTGELNVPPHRWSNAMYAYNALERVKTGARTYYDMRQHLPGDCTDVFENATVRIQGDGDGRIERQTMENVKFFKDLYEAGIMPSDVILIRGRELEIYWTRLKAKNETLNEGNFFKLMGFNLDEARALDYQFDDAWNDTGDVYYSINDDGTANLYVNFDIFD